MRYLARLLTFVVFLGSILVTYLYVGTGNFLAVLCGSSLAVGLGVMVGYDVWRTSLEWRRSQQASRGGSLDDSDPS